jgi:hypothetical protein
MARATANQRNFFLDERFQTNLTKKNASTGYRSIARMIGRYIDIT